MKILGSDYDGTLTRNGVTDEKLSAIEKWRSLGNKFGIVTGRGKEFCKILSGQYPKLKLDFVAMCNGGYILDGEGHLIYEARCCDLPLPELIEDMFGWGCDFVNVSAKDFVCVVKKQEDCPPHVSQEEVCLQSEYAPVAYFNQISVLLPSLEEASKTVEKIKSKYANRLNPVQNGRCIDIVPMGVNKAQGIYHVMAFFDGAYEDVIAVGDNLNDMDMIGEFRSYAMENGVEAVKAMADGVVRDVTEIFEIEM